MVQFDERVIETPGGRFSYAENGTGPTRLILHSLLTDRTAFDLVADSIGGHTVALDLPGFGATTPTGESIDEYAHKVAIFIGAAGLDPEGLTLIGNGLGAFVALGTVIHHGDLASKAILVGCGPGFPEPAKVAFTGMIEAAETEGMSAVVPVALRRIFTEEYISEHPDQAEQRARILERTDPRAFVTACRALKALDYSDLAGSITTPTLIVVGEDDGATPPELAEDLHRLIPASTLVRMPGIAHAPQLQDPAGFMNVVGPFLEE